MDEPLFNELLESVKQADQIMTDHAELRRLDDSEVEQLLERYIKRFPGEHKAAMSRYFEAVHQELAPLARKLEAERDRLKAENEALRGALHAVQAEVDGNLRPLTRDLVNMVSGLNNGCHPNDIYDHCDEIDRIIDAALEGGKDDRP
ncbi:hypothetical protein QCC34_07430 [Pseudomonas aeruginosa]|uniref:hypothetical protein n=1 Tax=Pseudomonas aeruginosa TaxID=287 RepID=UPI0013601AB7|nr:hypothetical protein [Pseudomonas aeruginosa]MDO5935729.1 hypothetical protein [Pseudomonas aeruginosa]MDO5949478.1 hypothetical protein [Pseudomonas aeruginosa]MWW06579.1 hypothetical protein [Pseudomonas aeruginosa]HCP6202337.1 hypothetical protein [Pseudomonas aeruginosa]HCP6219895.1 hypothetical protein [Pseudomonas aeruginosa]